MEKRPRGRPPMECVDVNKKTFQRKKEATIKKAQVKKCVSRVDHPYKPCKLNKNNTCVPATKGKCTDVRPKPKAMFNSKTEQKKEIKQRCAAKATSIGKKCVVPNTKKLVCKDASNKRKASKEGKYVPGMYKS